MKNIYRNTEYAFEKLTSAVTSILGNSITFIFAMALVVYWVTNKEFYEQGDHKRIGDIILATSFLSLFVIQKAFNKFSASLHLKVNELVVSHEPASNSVLNIEGKTEIELLELTKEYAELAEIAILEKQSEETKP